VLEDSTNPDLGRKFVDYVTGEAGQNPPDQAGFAKP
jgi:ABC-type Fe3+ transport system substrate-binding protein